ncbi:hypothetical protein N7539_009145 [Penicillium diatomitis]|uniref:Uncharacterized protein n=1 Tax=Penicillium diatomitis TaxID=2819901 RepID=A0A9W9WLC8_9EURO|nr:uncharacterized protein N7539_009145 [Penicillium diatomitis]KAJ5469527.1 hypothetical protein N7539_009145 [Penicillium diatomitis]
MPMFGGSRMIENGRDYVLPFDVFSPLPPGQPKPDEWRKTNKNVFVGDAASEWKANKKLELSTCMCEEDTGCDENCQNRYMFYECDSGNCRLGPECGNRNFSELKHRTKAGGKYNIGVEVIKTSDRGYGVRSNRTFEPNQIIVEYTGEIITQFECERRMRTVYKKNEVGFPLLFHFSYECLPNFSLQCYYLMYFDQNMIIDATRGSIARFVNHSCEPNCRMEKWTVAGKPRMALFAGDRGIMTGEELSYDYNFDPYSLKNVQQCRCGSENCRGILGPRPKDKDQRAKMEEKAQAEKEVKKPAGKKRKLADAESADSQKGKKRKILNAKSIKAGVKKVVAKATARGKTGSKKTVKSATTTKSKAKKTVTLPKVKVASRVKATVANASQSKGKAAKTKVTAASSSKGSSVLKRPSLETKKKILARAKGTGRASPKKSPAKIKKGDAKSPRKPAGKKAAAKSPVKPRVPPSKVKKNGTGFGTKAQRTIKGSVKKATKSVVRTIKGKSS